MMEEVYMLCGVYKEADDIIAYRLMRSDGKIRIENKEQVVKMIDSGIISNMRVQRFNGEVLLRGKGININNVRTYNKEELDMEFDNHDRYRINRSIIHNNKKVGYELIGINGDRKLLDTEKVCNMINSGYVSNAVLRRVNHNGKIVTAIIGKGIRIKEIDEIVINSDEIISSEDIQDNSCRILKMDCSGIIENTVTKEMTRFKNGDYIIYCVNGKMYTVGNDVEINYIDGCADADINIRRCERYVIKRSNNDIVSTDAESVKSWRAGYVNINK